MPYQRFENSYLRDAARQLREQGAPMPFLARIERGFREIDAELALLRAENEALKAKGQKAKAA